MPVATRHEPGAVRPGSTRCRDVALTTPRLRRPPDALWHRTSRRIVVSPGAGAATLDLRDIPALVWEALEDELSLDELVDDLAAVFDQPPDAIRGDVHALVDAMAQAGAVHRA